MKKARLSVLFVLLAFSGLPFSSFASDGALSALSSETSGKALSLLKSMTESFSTLNYEGVFVHSEAMNMNSMRIRHSVLDDSVYESLEDLDGDKLEVLRINDMMVCVYLDASAVNRREPLNKPFPHFKNVESTRLLKGYNLAVNPRLNRIAGRNAKIVTLTPKDEYRFGHEFWLDQENDFLLKHDLIKSSGKLLERTQFTSVNFAPGLKVEDFTPKKGSYSEPIVEAEHKYTKNVWHFDWLPDGFELVWSDARILNHSTTMLLLSDGLTNISVFVEPAMTVKNVSVFRTGATFAGETSFKTKDQLYLLTVVGEVPRITIEKLMTAFMPRHSK
ncbi:MucB/RseB C-terminal domain-containing protein [Marinomonas sp.]|nr:MucB/RseB C-terminal domain-containing protein [Marinomonas sp.]MDB4837544.1 MucB/RseB C-terminal domain-containing protein [Marinomonas sp.]